MLGNIGFVEACLITAIIAALFVWPVWRIVTKMGYAGILALGFFIPIVNIGLVLFLAFSEWPIERGRRESPAQGSFV